GFISSSTALIVGIIAAGRPLVRTSKFTKGNADFSCDAAKYPSARPDSRRLPYFESLAIPMISIVVSGTGYPMRNVRPTGLADPKNFLTADSPRIATFGELGVSRSLKSRPATIGVPNVLKKSGLTVLTHIRASIGEFATKPST